jgi:hypothetical protein
VPVLTRVYSPFLFSFQPLSKKHKKFILGLDIEADARILRERLNLDTKAIDYFRASSKLLQAGVKAGLSLYEIAVMCCRNDNAGEIPSKLEVLTSMAVELASKAVENGRWHHSAASRALAEQLSPGGGSLLVNPRVREPAIIFKSASTENLMSLREAAATVCRGQTGSVPGMANSSVSDSNSSDSDDPTTEREECDEWAASVVADVRLDSSLSMSMLRSKARSPSVESNDSDTQLSSSPQGFWYRRPGSERDEDSDDESLSLSPREDRPAKRLSVSFVDDIEESFKSPTVTFTDELTLPAARATVNVETFKKSSLTEAVPSIPPSLSDAKPTSLVRAQSYAAFSRSSSLHSTASSSSDVVPTDTIQFHDYFTKFVDLVITRETIAASRLQAGA